MNFIKVYLVAVVVFFIIDMIWLGVIAKNLYSKEIGHLLSPNVNWIAAIVFYLFFVAGMVYFVINPALELNSLKHALLIGIFFGTLTYATYDLTNLATLKDWPLKITIIDIIWGGTLSGLVSSITYYIIKVLE